MDDRSLHQEAEECRSKALSYLGRPEAPFLLHIAREFDRLAAEPSCSLDRVRGKERRD